MSTNLKQDVLAVFDRVNDRLGHLERDDWERASCQAALIKCLEVLRELDVARAYGLAVDKLPADFFAAGDTLHHEYVKRGLVCPICSPASRPSGS